MRFALSFGCTLAVLGSLCPAARAAERITLRNGFALTCNHRQTVDAGHVRLYLDGGSTSYLDVDAANIASAEVEPDLAAVPVAAPVVSPDIAQPDKDPLDTLVRRNGEAYALNLDLLHSVIHAESGGNPRAVSRAGAQGLMQLMPVTARSLGVSDSFAPDENVRGGASYLDTLLRRYNDNLALALAAYNAGPAAVARYHGIPPYRETQQYVARIIREFNRRTLLAQHATAVPPAGGPR